MKEKLSIREVAKNMNLTTRALRYYEELGLITSEQEGRGNRFYTKEQVSKIIYLNELKNRGFSLKEIEVLLGNKCCNEKKNFLENRVEENIKTIEFLKWQNEKILEEMEIIKKLDIYNIHLEIAEMNEKRFFILEAYNDIYSDPNLEKIYKSEKYDEKKEEVYRIEFEKALSGEKKYNRVLYPNEKGDFSLEKGRYLVAYSREGLNKQNIIFEKMLEFSKSKDIKLDKILYVENKFRIFCKREKKTVIITKNFIKIVD